MKKVNKRPYMKRHARFAFDRLKNIGAPVYKHANANTVYGEHFVISAEENDNEIWADYYDGPSLERVDEETGEIVWASGVNPKIHEILKRHNLFCEWIDAGMLGVYDA